AWVQPGRNQFGQQQGQRNAIEIPSSSDGQDIELNPAYLEKHRIVAHDGQDPRSRSFDMLRTEVLRSMDRNGWTSLAVTSPTPNCGKTLTAVNLALSMARKSE